MKTLETTRLAPWKNILFATDLSPASERALFFALNIARHFESKLYAVHVVPHDVYPRVAPSESTGMAGEEEQYQDDGKRHIEDMLSCVRHVLRHSYLSRRAVGVQMDIGQRFLHNPKKRQLGFPCETAHAWLHIHTNSDPTPFAEAICVPRQDAFEIACCLSNAILDEGTPRHSLLISSSKAWEEYTTQKGPLDRVH